MHEHTEITTAARRLERALHGTLHLPGDRAYDELRRPLDPAIDPRPAMVVEASRAADVRAALEIARDHDLPFAVQATGHGTRVPSDGGILVKTAAMATVLVDPDRRIARVGAGAVWGDVVAAAAIVTASADDHADLFWALRGGGGNFGVATALELRLHPVARVYAGTAYFAIDRAADTLARYRHWIAGAPDELSTAVLLTRLPDGRRVLALRAMFAGDAADAERHLAPLRAVAGPALIDGLRPMTFAVAEMGGTAPRLLELVDEFPDAVIDALVAADEATVEVRHWGGAMARPAADAGPVGHRDVPLSVIVDAELPAVAAALAPS